MARGKKEIDIEEWSDEKGAHIVSLCRDAYYSYRISLFQYCFHRHPGNVMLLAVYRCGWVSILTSNIHNPV